MDIVFQPARHLHELLLKLAAGLESFDESFDPQIRPADPRFGDWQANGVLAFAKQQRANPRALATALQDAWLAAPFHRPEWVEVSIAGPGFINFRFTAAYHLAWLERFGAADQLRVGAVSSDDKRTIVVDYSSPNTAKEMHVGHIRSTVIGEAISRLLVFFGHKVIRDNHIGDWGTQFGMLIWAIKDAGYDLDNPGPNAIADLEQLYKNGNARYKESPEAADGIRAELVKLQGGDPENAAIWRKITEISWSAFQEIYDQLGVRFDERLGESFYCDKVDTIYRELTETGLAEENEGALVVFHPEHPRFSKQPFIVRKADGASNYATTDLATILYRAQQMSADEMIYVVDSRQSDHFEQLFLTARKWFQARGWPVPQLKHVSFGTILGANGKPIKTKEGASVKLKELLAEAAERSYEVVTTKSPDLPEAQRREIARVVGLGAVRYVDLSQNRSTDYIFNWERMLAFEGNTAPYLLYAVARLHSIFRKAGEARDRFAHATGIAALETESELALARKLTAFPAALDAALVDLRPHFLCAYLYELSGVFSSFYTNDKVNVEDEAIRHKRLFLCERTLTALETGLHLLGLETLEAM